MAVGSVCFGLRRLSSSFGLRNCFGEGRCVSFIFLLFVMLLIFPCFVSVFSPASPFVRAADVSTSASTASPSDTLIMTPPDGKYMWSVVNLLFALAGVVLVVVAMLWVLLLGKKQGVQKDGGGIVVAERSAMWLAVVSMLGVIGVGVFLLPRNLFLPFGWVVDRLTVVHVVIFVVEVVVVYVCVQTQKNELGTTHKPHK
jgi:hypothetical protein